MTLDDMSKAVRPHGLMVMGHTDTHVLIGTDADWWDVFTTSPEYSDQAANPIDRWSKRIIGDMAAQAGARACYPSDGPPYAPFIAWALATGRFWQSPTGMMIHDTAGLMISIRGAIELNVPLPSATPAHSPCDGCADRPCVNACPVGALSAVAPYDVPVCKTYLASPPGSQCMAQGCQVRRACPVSQRFDRPDAQTAFHMKAFLG